MAGGYGTTSHGSLASRAGIDRRAEPRSPARHCLVNEQPGLLVEWRQRSSGWEGRVISVEWIDAVDGRPSSAGCPPSPSLLFRPRSTRALSRT